MPPRSLRVLVITTLLPGLRRTGSEVATQRFADAIRGAGHDVTLLAYRRIGTAPPLSPGDVAVADRHIETLTARAWPAVWMARALLTGRPYSVAKYVSRAFSRAVADALEQEPDLIVLDHAQMGWLMPREGWRLPMVYLAHNVEHALHAEMSTHGGVRAWAHRREERRIEEVERAIIERADALWTLSEGDAEVLKGLAPELPVRVFGTPPVRIPEAAGTPEHDVVILGGWHWRPNAAGLRWFAEEVAPHLAAEGVEAVVGGASGSDVVGDAPGVCAVGSVPDALDFLQSGRVVAVPSTAGAGVQIKTLDAIASGRPIVATSVAMRGIDRPPATVRVADDPGEFAREILRTLGDATDAAASDAARRWAVERDEQFQATVRAGIAEAMAAAA